MSFYERFELLDLVRDDGIKSFQARETSTGRDVLVHLFVNHHAPESVALLSKLDRLAEGETARIVDRGEHEGTPYVVTDCLPEYAGLREWLVAKGTAVVPEKKNLHEAGAWKVVPPAPTPPPATRPSLDEQFAGLFETGERPQVTQPRPAIVPEETLRLPTPAITPPPLPEAPPTTAAPATDASQGEFTKLSQPPPAPPAPPSAPPGEFTRMFQPPVPSPGSTQKVPPPGPPPQPPGEFTRMFQAPLRPSIPTQPEARALERPKSGGPPSGGPPSEGPGEFTQMFQSPLRPPIPTQPDARAPERPKPGGPPSGGPPSGGPGEFTQMFQSPLRPPMPTQPDARPPDASKSAGPPSGGPGEFTRMFQSPLRPSVPTQQDSRPPESSKSAGPPSGDPGEFTRFFETPIGSGPLPQSPAVRQPLTPQAPGTSGSNRVGEFTRVFGPRDVPAPPPSAPPASPPLSAGATQTFAAPKPPSSPAWNQQGPGEYTRMFSVAAPLTLGQPTPDAAAPASPSAAPPKPSRLPLILGITALAILLIAIVLFLVFRSK